eukprot:6000143-Pyramimonas_sp.AAC.1
MVGLDAWVYRRSRVEVTLFLRYRRKGARNPPDTDGPASYMYIYPHPGWRFRSGVECLGVQSRVSGVLSAPLPLLAQEDP